MLQFLWIVLYWSFFPPLLPKVCRLRLYQKQLQLVAYLWEQEEYRPRKIFPKFYCLAPFRALPAKHGLQQKFDCRQLWKKFVNEKPALWYFFQLFMSSLHPKFQSPKTAELHPKAKYLSRLLAKYLLAPQLQAPQPHQDLLKDLDLFQKLF